MTAKIWLGFAKHQLAKSGASRTDGLRVATEREYYEIVLEQGGVLCFGFVILTCVINLCYGVNIEGWCFYKVMVG